jgi:nucleoside-diphosphate-sugar epimerase
MNILITGAFGYIGTRLLDYLAYLRSQEGPYDVTAIDNFMYNQYYAAHHYNGVFEIENKDVRELASWDKLKEFDVIIHLAAIVGDNACNRNPKLATEVNLESVKNLIKALSPNQKIIFPMTNSGYGAKTGEVFCTEETPLEPISLYGRDKAEAEKCVLDFKNSITLRLATVFGTSPRQRLDLSVNDFCYKAYFDKEIKLFQPEFKRNFIHIQDVAECIEHCALNSFRMKGCYNFGLDNANMSKLELANKISEIIPCKVTISEDGFDPDKRNYIVSSEKMYKEFVPKYFLEDGIKELAKFFSLLPNDKTKREEITKNMRNGTEGKLLEATAVCYPAKGIKELLGQIRQ